MSDNRLKIGITQGDTNGIGWEVILKTLADSRIAELCTPVVYGSPAAAGYYRRCIADLEEIAFNTVSSARDARRGRVNLIACGPQELRIVPGEPSPEAGRAAVEALQAAVRDLKEGTLDALVTGPIDKETAQADDFRYTGAHRVPRRRTGRLAHDADVQRSAACGARDDAPAAGGSERRDLARENHRGPRPARPLAGRRFRRSETPASPCWRSTPRRRRRAVGQGRGGDDSPLP